MVNFIRGLFKRNEPPQKYYGGTYQGYDWQPILGGGFGRNFNFQTNETGAGNAYILSATVKAAIDTYAYAIASVPSRVIYNPTNDRNQDDVVAKSTDVHPTNLLYRAFQDFEKNYYVPFMLALGANYTMYDEIYVEKIRNPYGYPASLRVLNNLSIYPYILNGDIQYYEYQNPYDAQARHRFAPYEIAYNHGYHPAIDWRGTSILYAAMKAINIDDNLKDFLLDFFANNARPGIIFTAQDEPTQRNVDLWQRLRSELESKFTGRGNQFRSMTMPIPATVTELEQPDLEKQYVISDGIRKEILTAFGIPPVLVGDTTNTTFRNAPDARKVFIQQHLRDRMNMIANYITRELLPFFYPGNDYRFEFEWSTFDVMSDGDMLRVDSVNKQLAHGIISLAEAQTQLGQSADPDFQDIYMVNGKPASKHLLLELANNPLQFLAPQAYTTPRGLEGASTLEERNGVPDLADLPPPETKSVSDDSVLSQQYKGAPENTKFDSVTYNGITVQASPVRSSSRDDKKYMRYVRYKGDERLIHWGDPNMEMQRDNPERRQAFNDRHSCSEKKDPFASGFWACWHWQPSAKALADELDTWQRKAVNAWKSDSKSMQDASDFDGLIKVYAPLVYAELKGALRAVTLREQIYTAIDNAKARIENLGDVGCLTYQTEVD